MFIKSQHLITAICSIIMSYNVLEELTKEYYEYIKEYFVRTNVRFNKLDNGGYEGGIGVLSYDPEKRKFFV